MKELVCTVGLILSLAGCSLPPARRAGGSPTATNTFATYQETFRFIAQNEGLPGDAGTVFRLAADSSVEVLHFDRMPYFYFITARYYAGGIYDQIRGAQDNGRYYILRPLNQQFTEVGNLDRGFELACVAEGNTHRWRTFNDRLRLITTWHLSAAESATNIYEWNGKSFHAVKAGGSD
jgi:hypothetical protein